MTTTTNTYTRQNNPSSSYFHLPILLHPDQTAMDLLQHTQDTYRDACLDIVKFFEERNIDIAVFEKQYWEYRNKGEIHSEEDKSINQVKKIICQISYRLNQRFKLRIKYGQYPLATVMSAYRQAKNQHKEFNLEHSRHLSVRLIPGRSYDIHFQADNDADSFTCVLRIGKKVTVKFSLPAGIPLPPSSWKSKMAFLEYKHGTWMMRIAFRKPEITSFEQVSRVVGVDRGIINIATTYTPGNAKRYSRKEYLLDCGSSSSQDKGEQALTANIKIAREIVGQEPAGTVFVLEDLTFKDEERPNNWPYRHLKDMLTYFAALSGQWIYTCSPHDTSITCPVCGHVERANRLQNEHRFVCQNCGYGADTIVDDDENAARNIYERGKANLRKEFGNTLST